MNAPSTCSEHMPEAHATRICTDGRTDEQTETVAHVTNKSSLTDTCAHVQDFDTSTTAKDEA